MYRYMMIYVQGGSMIVWWMKPAVLPGGNCDARQNMEDMGRIWFPDGRRNRKK
jgi:hypothetical protein